MAKATTSAGAAKKAAKDKVKNILSAHKAENSDSESSSSSSDSDSDGESTLMKQIKSTKTELPSRIKRELPKPAAVVVQKEDSEESSSESESDSSSDESAVVVKKEPKKAATPAHAPPATIVKEEPENVSDESSSEDDESKSVKSEDSDVSMGDDNDDSDENKLSEQDLKAAGAPPDVIDSQFLLRSAAINPDSAKIAKLFSDASAGDKQLWYFTAPADVPVSVIESMEIPYNASSSTTLSFVHNGEDYTIDVDATAGNRKIALMIPGGLADNKYQCDVRRADAVLNVRRVQKTVGITGQAFTATEKTYRAQPTGLKMRFRPLGIADDEEMGRITYATSEDEAAPSPKKRKHKEAAAGDEQPKKKRKDKGDVEKKNKEKKEKKDKKKTKAERD